MPKLCRIPWIERLITMVSRYSFYVFLIQHRLIIKVVERYNPSGTLISLFLLIGTVMAALLFSHIFDKIIKKLLGSKLFLRFEKAITGTNL